jgi:hypothetical protein
VEDFVSDVTQSETVAEEPRPADEPRPAKSRSKKKRGCPECGSVYGVPYLYHHMRTAHGIFGGATGVKRMEKTKHRFNCPEPNCDREFDTQHGLNMHVSLTHKREAATSQALVPVNHREVNHREPTFRLSREWRIVEDDDGTPFLLLSLSDLISDRMAH